MGNQRFRLSHMIPNAWFYRLRDMNIAASTPHHKTSKHQQQQQPENHPRNSFCYTPKIHQVHRNINNKPTHESTQDLFYSPTNCSNCYESPLSESTQLQLSITTCSSEDNTKKIQDLSGYELIQETEFQELITKPKIHENSEDTWSQSSISTERIYKNEKYMCKRIIYDIDDQNKLSSSCCIVKPTFDPLTDLKESMMDMIVEHNMRAPEDLEKLLTCYLSLNSNEYHDIIVKAFKEICLTLLCN